MSALSSSATASWALICSAHSLGNQVRGLPAGTTGVLVCGVISLSPWDKSHFEVALVSAGAACQVWQGQELLWRDSCGGWQVGWGRTAGEPGGGAQSASKIGGECSCWLLQMSGYLGCGRGREMEPANNFVLGEVS